MKEKKNKNDQKNDQKTTQKTTQLTTQKRLKNDPTEGTSLHVKRLNEFATNSSTVVIPGLNSINLTSYFCTVKSSRCPILNENQFQYPGFTNGVRQFCGFQYFCYEILFYLVSSYSPFLSNLLNQNLQNVKTQKSKLGSFV